jgi:hypothetical protein
MTRSVTQHAVLLAVALAAAALTWTAEEEDPTSRETISVWDRSADEITGIAYRSGPDSVDVERRGTGEEAYLWGRQTSLAPPTIPPSPDDSADAAPPPAVTQVDEYPVGDSGPEVMDRLARLRALRDLGAADSTKKADYGLAGMEPSLTVRFDDGTARTLVFGEAIVGGGALYALDVEEDHIYVLSADLLSPFVGGAGALRLQRFQDFQAEQVASVTVRAGTAVRTMNARRAENPPRTVWVFPGEDRQDVAFGLFMTQLDQLWVTRYTPDVAEAALEPIARADYVDARGRALGYIEIFRARTPEGTTYYMRTPRTVVLGEVYPTQGERIEQDVRTQFRSEGAGA